MFVVGNRRGQSSWEPAVMHFGPAADDNVYQSIRFLETGVYDVLHTAGYQHVNHDLDIYLKARGAVIPV